MWTRTKPLHVALLSIAILTIGSLLFLAHWSSNQPETRHSWPAADLRDASFENDFSAGNSTLGVSRALQLHPLSPHVSASRKPMLINPFTNSLRPFLPCLKVQNGALMACKLQHVQVVSSYKSLGSQAGQMPSSRPLKSLAQ